jgi:hypothetical protein
MGFKFFNARIYFISKTGKFARLSAGVGCPIGGEEFRHFQILQDILQQVVPGFDGGGNLLDALERLLSGFLIVPEVALSGFCLQTCEFLFQGVYVKDTSCSGECVP